MKYSIYYATGAYKYLQKLQPQIARKIYLSMNNIANDNTIGKDINKLGRETRQFFLTPRHRATKVVIF